MSLRDDKQQNIQVELDFSSTPTGEARQADRKETEPARPGAAMSLQADTDAQSSIEFKCA
jgi:hypothetical protein